ncbi:hypothetical protein A9P82_05800 [Arachidicoccus ginsenosidimutans]|nr:hypothetical protein A9P82_05800 [Arachidicoccus sp. BS20]
MNLLPAAIALLLQTGLTGCTAGPAKPASSGISDTIHYGGSPIGTAQANRMISAYLANAANGATHSLFIDADTLRHYLNNKNIRALKFFLARPVDEQSRRATADSNRLTLVIAGIDADEHYVLTGNGDVYNEVSPCPTECPPGDAGSDLLP